MRMTRIQHELLIPLLILGIIIKLLIRHLRSPGAATALEIGRMRVPGSRFVLKDGLFDRWRKILVIASKRKNTVFMVFNSDGTMLRTVCICS